MKIHQLKIEKIYFDQLMTNGKRFELRYNDRNFEVGDLLQFVTISMKGTPLLPLEKYVQLTDGFGKTQTYKVERTKFKVTHILKDNEGVPGIAHGYCILSIKKQVNFISLFLFYENVSYGKIKLA